MGRKPKDEKGSDLPSKKYLDSLNSLRKFSAIADRRGRLQFATEAPLKALGYSQDDFLRKPFWEASLFGDSQDSRNAVKDGIVGALEGQSVECRVQAFTSDGTALPVTFNISPLKGAEGDIVGIMAAGEPIEEAAVEDHTREARVSSFDLLLKNIQEAFFETNNSERLTLVSSAAAKLLGYKSSEQMIGLGTDQLWSNPEDRDKFLIELSRKGRVEKYHATFLREDGTEVPVELTAHLMLDLRGEIIGSQGIFTEIGKKATPDVLTERKKEEPTGLQELVKKFIALTEQTSDAVAIVQNDEIKFANPCLARMLGCNVAELEGTNFTQYVSPQSLKLVKKMGAKRTAGDETPSACDIEIVTTKGKRMPVQFSTRAVDHGGRPAELILIREKEGDSNVEEAVLEAERRYRAIFDNPLVMIFVSDDQGQFLDANDAGLKRLGYTREDLGKVRYQDVVHPDDFVLALQVMAEGIEKGYNVRPTQLRALTKSGEIVWIEVCGVLLERDGQHVVGLNIARDMTEHVQAEEVLKRSERYFRSLIENASDSVAVVDAAGRVLYQSPSTERIFGYTQKEQFGKDYLGFVHPDDLPQVMDAFSRMLKTPGTSGAAGFRIRHKDGSWRYIEAVVRNLLDDPVVKGVVINYRDVTERKQAEETLLRIGKAVESASDAIGISDPQGNHFYHNKAFTDLLGYTPEELAAAGGGPAAFADQDTARQVFGAIMRGESWSGEIEMLSRSGRRFPALMRADAIKDERGRIVGLIGVITDITERKHAEEALQRRERYFQSLIELSSDGMLVLDRDLKLKWESEPTRRIFGYAEKESIGKSALDFVHPDDEQNAMNMITSVTSNPEGRGYVEVRLLREDGSWCWTGIMAKNHLDNPDIEGLVLNVRDISERKKSYEALREAQRRYLAIFNNPLNIVYICDEHAIFVDANDEALKKLGYSRDDLGKLSFQEIIHPDDLEFVLREFAQAMTKGLMDHPIEIRLLTKGREPVWVETYVFALERPGASSLWMGIARDITERKHAEEELKAYQERLKDALAKLRVSYEELSTPVVQIWDHVLAMPLIGVLDTGRAKNVMDVLLNRIVEARAEVVVIDVTGVAAMDTQVTNHLLQTAASTELLGAECVITGIKPEVAQAMIHIGVDITRLNTKRDLQEGLKYALSKMGHDIGAID